MQLFNTQKSLSDEPFHDRIHELKSAYPLLSTITDPLWLDTIEQAKIQVFKPSTILFSGTSSCNNFMLILEGTIRLFQSAEDGREITLYRVQAGDLCMLSLNSLLKKQAFNAIAETESHVRALSITSDDFRQMMNISTTFRDYVVSTLTERLCDALYLIQDTAFNHLDMRLACMLGSLFERNQNPVLKVTHQELAHELGTTREVVSRILKEFERKNCIKLSRGNIELASAEGLQWFTRTN